MIKLMLAVLAAVAVWGATPRTSDANCWKTRPCTGADPCVLVTSWFCGTGCELGPWAGATGCGESANGNCLKATVVGPGCCSSPCPPPANECEPGLTN